MKKRNERLCYVFRSAKGFDRYSEFGHPEIEICSVEKYDGYTSYRELICISGQIDKDHLTPYALRVSVPFDALRSAQPITTELYRQASLSYSSVRAVLKTLHKLGIERYTHSGWCKNYSGKFSNYVPYAHRNHIDLWVEADKAGLSLNKLEAK